MLTLGRTVLGGDCSFWHLPPSPRRSPGGELFAILVPGAVIHPPIRFSKNVGWPVVPMEEASSEPLLVDYDASDGVASDQCGAVFPVCTSILQPPFKNDYVRLRIMLDLNRIRFIWPSCSLRLHPYNPFDP